MLQDQFDDAVSRTQTRLKTAHASELRDTSFLMNDDSLVVSQVTKGPDRVNKMLA